MESWPELEALQRDLRRIVQGDEDALQQTNLRLLERRASIRNLPAYAGRTAKRCRIDQKRPIHARSVPLTDHPGLAVPAPTPLEVLCTNENRERVEAAKRRLTDRQRDALENPRGRANNSIRYKAMRNLRRDLEGNGRGRDDCV